VPHRGSLRSAVRVKVMMRSSGGPGVDAHRRDGPPDPTRRTVVRGLGTALAGALAAPSLPGSGWSAQAIRYSSLFTLGVCSGDPGTDGFVIWTRLAPDPLAGGGMGPGPVEVLWEVATDPDMGNVVQAGITRAVAARGHAVTVRVGGLAPDRWYWYRFSALGERSRTGRSRTFPRAGGPGRDRPLRFALASCQDFQDGYYAAYRDMLEQDLDLVVHVGDYIYEKPGRRDVPDARRHPGGELDTLADYRNRYALYRLDEQLQDAHAAYPFVVTPDDHEVDNNYAGFAPEDRQAEAAFRERRRNAYRAYDEAMPLTPRTPRMPGDLDVYRRLHFGDLATFHVLDTRQYRTDQPCPDAFPAPEALCRRRLEDAGATLLGRAQERWLVDGLRRGEALWNVITQQVMMAQWDLSPVGALGSTWNADAWDGYRIARDRLLDFLARERPSNPVVLSGDIHSAWAADLLEDFSAPDSRPVAAEFVCTGITSGFFMDALAPLVELTLNRRNGHIRFFEGVRRGYCLCEVTPSLWRTDYRAVVGAAGGIFTVPSPDLPLETIASFGVRAGRPGLVRL
jgi:alkaline phosphatase D